MISVHNNPFVTYTILIIIIESIIINNNKCVYINAFSSLTFINNSNNNNYNKKLLDHNNNKYQHYYPLQQQSSNNDESASFLSEEENRIKSMTVPEIKQQLRLRGLKVSGVKNDLIVRLLDDIRKEDNGNEGSSNDTNIGNTDNKAKEFYKEYGKELIDVSEFIKDESNKEIRSSTSKEENDNSNDKAVNGNDEVDDDDDIEVWGEEAKVLYENDDKPVVDNLSRTIIEYKSKISFNNKDRIKSYVVASREALRGYLSGGGGNNKASKDISNEEKVKETQISREKDNKIPMIIKRDELQNEDMMGVSYDPEEPDADKDGRYGNLNRDYTDWGTYTTTGAQISASEVEGILVLPDVYGPFSNDNKALCDRIAFECQPCVVMSPDLFRDVPWNKENDNDYEEWRSMHTDERVNIDIRSSANILKERYGISSIAVFGVCFGGGRALEIAANYIPKSSRYNHYDVPLVHPKVCVAWYPTRYDKQILFGNNKSSSNNDSKNKVAIMALFAEKDITPGATKQDAEELKYLLENNNNDNIMDYMIKVYTNQQHGFAHQEEKQLKQSVVLPSSSSSSSSSSLSGYYIDPNDIMDDNDDDVYEIISSPEKESAFLLSTAWIETYTRLFLPTVGTPIKDDVTNSDWSTNIEMKDLNYFHNYYEDDDHNNDDDDYDVDENMNMNIRDKIRSKIEKDISEHSVDDDDLDYSDVRMQQW